MSIYTNSSYGFYLQFLKLTTIKCTQSELRKKHHLQTNSYLRSTKSYKLVMMADYIILEEDAQYFARQAVLLDSHQEYEEAKFYYMEAAQALLAAKLAGSPKAHLCDKANEYILRYVQQAPKSHLQRQKERADFLVRQAFDEDEAGNETEAAELYMEAAQLCIEMRKSITDSHLKGSIEKLAKNAIERVEAIKNVPKNHQSNKVKYRPLGDALATGQQLVSKKDISTTTSSRGSYTKEEIGVLRHTSLINGRQYVPFMSVDVSERFAFPVSFSDRDGKLALSAKQKQHFAGWIRPEEYIADPKMIMAVSSFSVKQTIISDCSFVASLAISAQYERRFNKRLITSIIYPQSRNGDPVYNPCGKYMIKLHINGVPRKVVIDDYLPMGKDGRLLCSFSSNKSELWVSMLEKAYMKVMGGYDFPGSNSNIDLHALTGWIPERVAIKNSSKAFEKDKEFRKILDKFHKGHCVVTVATGPMRDSDAERAGLVESHAYAMLDIREVLGKRFLMLKNPWSHLRWKGRYSESDTQSWTAELKAALNYDPVSAQKIDNGVFWIDYDSFCHFYECIYINWKPDLFKHTTCFHHTWTSKEGPTKDMYNISDNPQYTLKLKNPSNSPAAVWILLTRHITDKDDFANNKEFITVFVYQGGSRVYYPYNPAPYKDGIKINSPHYLCKMVESGNQYFTLVVSQYEKVNTIHYTLRVYSQCEFSLNKIVDPYKHEKEKTGEWKGVTAGGCANYPTNKNNPIYQVTLDSTSASNHLLVELRAPREYSVGIEAKPVNIHNPSAQGNQQDLTSGSYRNGYCILSMENISGGVYNIIPSTFLPAKEGHFILKFSSSCPMTVSKLR
ncbi:CAPN7 [Bugula neritina]|uniref:CAPN7 n=1 Tax=Bugula neritina TaxID=10212 RepID=A0A7J7KSM4_BUGNE|nr:CAPN7 [Bugula neritina]